MDRFKDIMEVMEDSMEKIENSNELLKTEWRSGILNGEWRKLKTR